MTARALFEQPIRGCGKYTLKILGFSLDSPPPRVAFGATRAGHGGRAGPGTSPRKAMHMGMYVRRRLLAGSVAFSLAMCAVALAGTPGQNYAATHCGPGADPYTNPVRCRDCCINAALPAADESDCLGFCSTTKFYTFSCPWYEPWCYLL